MQSAHRNVGFIGLGIMGGSMANHLLQAGYTLHIFTRSPSKAKDLLDKGAKWLSTVKEIAAQCATIITMVSYPSDVEAVYFGKHGLIENAKPGTLLIDCTTSRPDIAIKIYKESKDKGLYAIDAPVSGGDVGARNATLTIMVGGDAEALERARPILKCMGKTIVLQGSAGAGQHTKIANQITIAGNLLGAVEALCYAKAAGLNQKLVLESIGGGSAGSWQLNKVIPRALEGDLAPGFYVKHFLKDLSIALDSAAYLGLDLPLLQLAQKLFDTMCKEGMKDMGIQVLLSYYQRTK